LDDPSRQSLKKQDDNGDVNRKLVGAVVGVLTAVSLGLVMLPERSHLTPAGAAIWFVISVVAGSAIGGWSGGLASVTASFLIYDFAFVPPYDALTVDRPRNWTPLAVYVVVMAIVAILVGHLHRAQSAARSRAASARHLLGLSDLLLTADSAPYEAIVNAVKDTFGIEGVALLRPVDGHLEVVASAGMPIGRAELSLLRSEAQVPVSLSTGSSDDSVQTLALASSGRPVGLLALRNTPTTEAVHEALPILANHLAIALERGELRERIHHAELLEEIDELRQALVGAVSHDLRTPLATIKVASSTLVDLAHPLASADVHELHVLIDLQADRLARLVSNLLDMTRIQTGALEVRRERLTVNDLVEDAISELRTALGDRAVHIVAPNSFVYADADRMLIGQVLVNLLDNANRYAPADTPITIEIVVKPGGLIEVAVVDSGTGVPVEEREAVFERFVRFDTGGRSGLGLAIAKAFTEAHGSRIWVEDGPGGGARFVFTLPPTLAHNGAAT
jgi:two-component system sensor histidine kinase KdpD